MNLKELTLDLAKKCMAKKMSYEDAFNEIFFRVHSKPLPKNYKFSTKNKIIK